MQRIVVARQLGERVHVLSREGERTSRPLANAWRLGTQDRVRAVDDG